jgi:hypothetical protein
MKEQAIAIEQMNLFDIDSVERSNKREQSKSDPDNYVFDLIDALRSPILTFSTNWADSIPERMIRIIPLARMAALMKQETTATYAEATVYIYTRALEAPMDRDWTDIYTHVSCQTLQDWFKEDRWDDVQAPKSLNTWLQSQLDRLRSHIYGKRRSILKARMKMEERQPASLVLPAAQSPGSSQQQSLF